VLTFVKLRPYISVIWALWSLLEIGDCSGSIRAKIYFWQNSFNKIVENWTYKVLFTTVQSAKLIGFRRKYRKTFFPTAQAYSYNSLVLMSYLGTSSCCWNHTPRSFVTLI